uniref:Endo/exonuclease/phosphatase domain-containing protein n=1 Tax=Anopheles albimanus TaxID=7167 RepID=A0A182F472_ANOAL
MNCNGCSAAQDLLNQAARTARAEVLLVSHPHRIPSNGSWEGDTDGIWAIVASGANPVQRIRCRAPGVVIADVAGITFASCYAPPRWTLRQYQTMLDLLRATLRDAPPVVVGGDFNAWSKAWSSRMDNLRGRMLTTALEDLGLVLQNSGRKPTYLGSGVCPPSWVDVTFASPSALVSGWHVTSRYTNSDHAEISFVVGERTSECGVTRTMVETLPRWKVSHFDKERFTGVLEAADFSGATTVAEITRRLTSACDEVMPRSRRQPGKQAGQPMFWWTPEIEMLQWHCQWAHSRVHRRATAEERKQMGDEKHEIKRLLTHAIRRSKKRCLEALAQALDGNPFGDSFKIAMGWFRGSRRPPEVDADVLEGGPTSETRRIIATVTESTIRYAAPMWADAAMAVQTNRRILRRVQKVSARGVN